MLIGLLAALVAAVLQGAASSLQARGALAAKGAAVLSPLFLVGVGLDGIGWVVSLAAVTTLPLLVVEPVLAGSLVVTLLLNVVLLRLRPTALGWVATGLIVGAATVLALAGAPGPSHAAPRSVLVALALAVLLLLVGMVFGYRGKWAVRMSALGGLGFAGASIAARGLVFDGVATATEPDLWLVLVFGLIGTLAFARGLEQGGAQRATASTAWLWVLEIAVPSSVGLLFLGDGVRPGFGILAGLALPLVLLGAVLISQDRATRPRVGGSALPNPQGDLFCG